MTIQKLALAMSAIILVGAATLVHAGSRQAPGGDAAVTVYPDGSGVAAGTFGHIYNNPNAVGYIGCQASAGGRVLCVAMSQNANGTRTYGSCQSSSSYLAKSVAALGSDARLSFSWNAQGRCVNITVIRSSRYESKR